VLRLGYKSQKLIKEVKAITFFLRNLEGFYLLVFPIGASGTSPYIQAPLADLAGRRRDAASGRARGPALQRAQPCMLLSLLLSHFLCDPDHSQQRNKEEDDEQGPLLQERERVE